MRAVKEPSGLPYTILVTNGRLFTEAKYLSLRALGVNQFSISLDFPDARHDGFRQSPGLYAHLSKFVPTLAARGFDDVALNTAITRENLPTLRAIYDRANSGASVSPTAPTRPCAPTAWTTTSAPSDDFSPLRRTLDDLLDLKAQNGRIANSPWTLWESTISSCTEPSLVARPGGTSWW